jgi:hypothetical protein
MRTGAGIELEVVPRKATSAVKVFHFRIDTDYFHLAGANMFNPSGG